MSDEGEKTCPLCAEEMDLTDQQLKPCKCGYEICIWCWHHIMDMAEKDDSEGRCPACRTPYDKEKIVGMAAKCERLVAEMSMEKKLKSQKGKSKTSEGRKQLSSVRVIQRNLVYIVGLPLNLADEDVLQRKEYFSQYGKVQKVSISRTAAGTIQHFANNTCSVYITYSKEEEALRCIQAVHNFVLEGRQLRACFGTTKYCHAWLRNVPCSNPDCLYLHEIGSEEATFIKDDSVSSYTRNKVQQITGATCDTQRRSGNFLPPPADDYSNNCSSSWGKPISKNPTNQNPPSTARVSPPKSSAGLRVSPPNSSSGRSVALPAAAAWGTRSSNNQPLAVSVVTSNGPSKQRIDSCDGSLSLATAVVSHVSHGGDVIKKPNEETDAFEHKGKLEQVDIVKEYIGVDQGISVSEKPVTIGLPTSSDLNSQICTASSRDTNKSSHELSMSNNRHHGLRPVDAVKLTQTSAFFEPENALRPMKDMSVPRERSDLVSDLPSKVAGVGIGEPEVDVLAYRDRRLGDSEIVTNRDHTHNLPPPSNISSDRKGYSPEQAYVSLDSYTDPPLVGQNLEKISDSHAYSAPVIPNGYSMNLVSSSCLDSSIANSSSYTPEVGRFEDGSANVARNSALAMGESSIISNILSMDFDPWDESLTSPQNLAKLLGETDKQQGPLRISNSWKSHNNNQSRFSFAREEECTDQGSNLEPSVSDITLGLKFQSLTRDSSRGIYGDNLRNENGFSSFSFEESDNFANNHSPIASHKISVTRAQLSAPPGFSGPTRTPPPGFTSHERMERTFDNFYGNHMFDTSSLLREPHQALSPVNIGGAGDIELADPAILAVGGRVPGGINSPGLDMRSNFPAQWNSFETDARIHLLSQRPFSPQQTQRYLELGENFPSRTNAYGISSRIAEQALANNRSLYSQSALPQSRSAMMSNGHWDGWNEVQSGNDMAMADLLRSERLGLNKFYSTGYEDTKFGLPNSGDLYNRTFGI